MASTSVHLPEDLVERLDRLARELGKSRNRLIRDACEAFLAGAREKWPDDFFSDERLTRSDVKVLRESLEDWMESIASSRHNRAGAPF